MSKIRVNEIETLDGKGEGLISYPYEANFLIENHNTIIRDGDTEYKLSESTLLPYTTTGAGLPEDGAFVTVGDAALRQDLVQPVATFNNVADMAAATGLGIGRKARTLGYYTPGDGGGNDYEIVPAGTGTDDGGSFIDLSGSGLQARGLFSREVDTEQFGIGGADPTQALQNAVDYAASQGIKHVNIGPGSFTLVFKNDSSLQRYSILGKSGVHIRGSGIDNTILTLANSQDCHMFLWRGQRGFGLSSMTLDGNRLNQGVPASGSDPQGIGLFDTAHDYVFEDLIIKSTFHYAIGVELGTSINGLIRQGEFFDCGSDAIDFKNSNNDSEGNVISDVIVHDFGLTRTQQAGIDLRGEVQVSNVKVYGFGGTHSGIRFMPGETSSSGGLGARRSQLNGANIKGSGGSESKGMWLRHQDIQVSNVYVEGCRDNIVLSQRGISISNARSEGATRYGVLLDGGEASGGNPLPTNPDLCSLSNIFATNSATSGFRLQDNCVVNTFTGCHSRDSAVGFNIQAGSNNNSFIGGSSTNNTTSAFSDGATGTRVVAMHGVTDK